MKRPLIAALAAGISLLPAVALAESRTLDVSGFHALDVSSGIRAIISAGKPVSAVAEANDPEDLADLRHEVRGGTLYLWYDWKVGDLFDWSKRDITVTIGTELLDDLEANSGASIDAAGLMGEEIGLEASSGASIRSDAIEGMFYDIEASSGARIEVSGLCTSADIEASSGASIAARGLDCGKLDFEVSSGASLEATARDSVKAEVSSGASATIHGKPSIDTLETSSGGSVSFPD